jgi:hypothetical protein
MPSADGEGACPPFGLVENGRCAHLALPDPVDQLTQGSRLEGADFSMVFEWDTQR